MKCILLLSIPFDVLIDGTPNTSILPGQSATIELDAGDHNIEINSSTGNNWTYSVKIEIGITVMLTPQIFSPQEK